MKLAEHPKIFAIMKEFWSRTYCSNAPIFEHPFGEFDCHYGYMYINRVCYRVPDLISNLHRGKKSRPLQRSLTPHLDCCPTQLYNSGKNVPRWRPIQSLIALTPNLEASTGGFEAVPGFHHEFQTYFAKKSTPVVQHPKPVCIGDFSPLSMSKDKGVIQRFEHIPYEAGSLVLWDWRIPHANAYHHRGMKPREVVFVEYLPDVPVNRTYARKQLEMYLKKKLPVDHWQNPNKGGKPLAYEFHDFSTLGAQLIGLCPWE